MLYLHIGTSKTGSTSIQHFLTQTPLERFGLGQIACFGLGNAWKLAAASGTRNAERYWVEHRKRMSKAEFDRNRQEIWDQLSRELASADSRDFVASTEFLYRHCYGEPRALEVLRDRLLAGFGDVRIILYLRDQRDYLRSFYAQTVVGHTRSAMDFDSFISRTRRSRELWDYRTGVRLWAQVFGAERLTVIPFDRANFIGHDLIRDFVARLPVSMAALPLPGDGFAPENVTPGYAQVRMIRALNQRSQSPGHPVLQPLRWLVASRLGRLLPGPADFPTSHDAEILAQVSAGNAWLNETFLKDFAMRLPVAGDPG